MRLIIGILFLAAIMFSGCLDEKDTDKIYTMSTEEIVLSKEDLSDDWKQTRSNNEGDTSTSQFIIYFGFAPTVINCNVTKFESIDKASEYYNSVYNDFSTNRADYDSFSLGQESFSAEYALGNREITVFRKGNMVVVLQESFGSDTQECAKKIYHKIK